MFFAAPLHPTSGKTDHHHRPDTLSSLTEKGRLVVAALTAVDHILGISDLTFLTDLTGRSGTTIS